MTTTSVGISLADPETVGASGDRELLDAWAALDVARVDTGPPR